VTLIESIGGGGQQPVMIAIEFALPFEYQVGRGSCQFNRNASSIGAPKARSRLRQAARFCHSANAAERRAL